MAAIGADPEALDDVARALHAASAELDATARRLDAALGRTGWSGPDAERFRRSWQSIHRRALIAGSTRSSAAARQLVRHAAEQRRASLSTGRAATVARHERRAPSNGETTVVRGSLHGSVGLLTASLTGTLTITEVGALRRVTYTDDVSAGAGASVGTGGRVAWDDRALGRGATAEAVASVDDRVTRTWTVEPGAVRGLLLALAVEQDAVHSPVGAANRAATQGLRVAGALAGAIGVDLPFDADPPSPAPPPERTEDLVGIRIGVGAWAAVIGTGHRTPTGAELHTAWRVAAGTAEEGGRRSVLLEAEGAVAAALLSATPMVASVRDHAVGAVTSLRIEAPVGRGGPVEATVTSRGGDGDEEVVRVSVDGSAAPAVSRAAERAIRRLRGGDLPGALASLADVRAPDASVRVDATRVRVDAHDLAAEAVGGVGSIGVDGAVERRRIAP